MRKIFAEWLRRHRERRLAHELTRLDERTLRDIGLEPWRSELGAKVEQLRGQPRRWREMHLGMY